jgi:Uma2 family endonuclease
MEKRISPDEYFRMPETNRPQELVYGFVREPPAPFFGHQNVVLQIAAALKIHVDAHRLGIVCVSPLDVVLDEPNALVVQPDVIFVSDDRRSIIRDRIWGAPDLVVEVASPGGENRDRTLKLAWYRRYGVRECWLADPRTRQVEVVDCQQDSREVFPSGTIVKSRVLPELQLAVEKYFDGQLVP